jgi:RNase P/RNase MRP subunit p30
LGDHLDLYLVVVCQPAPVVTEAVANARVAALADPEGERLDDTIARIYAQVTTKVAPKLVSVP